MFDDLDVQLCSVIFLGPHDKIDSENPTFFTVFLEVIEGWYPPQAHTPRTVLYSQNHRQIKAVSYTPFKITFPSSIYLHKEIFYSFRYEIQVINIVYHSYNI